MRYDARESEAMQLHIFTSRGAVRRADNTEARVRDVVETLAADTDTGDLVVATYLTRHKDLWHAEATTRPVTRRMFERGGRKWGFVARFDVPRGLPRRFHLIRMVFGMGATYPMTVRDVYDWELRCERFEELVAYTFAHELHHFRKYALGLHPRQGEQAACKYALAVAPAAGYGVTGRRVKPRKTAALNPHAALLRALPKGAALVITHDTGPKRYLGQPAIKLHTPRRGKTRIAIRTADGREWYWPMNWLALPQQAAPTPEARRQGMLPF